MGELDIKSIEKLIEDYTDEKDLEKLRELRAYVNYKIAQIMTQGRTSEKVTNSHERKK